MEQKTIDEVQEKLIANFDEVRGLIRRITLIPEMDVRISVEWNPKREKFNIEVKSDDIKNPIIDLAWKEFRIESFGSGWLQTYANGEIEVGVGLCFFYRNHHDGTNCTAIGDIHAMSGNDWKWEFIPENGYKYV